MEVMRMRKEIIRSNRNRERDSGCLSMRIEFSEWLESMERNLDNLSIRSWTTWIRLRSRKMQRKRRRRRTNENLNPNQLRLPQRRLLLPSALATSSLSTSLKQTPLPRRYLSLLLLLPPTVLPLLTLSLPPLFPTALSTFVASLRVCPSVLPTSKTISSNSQRNPLSLNKVPILLLPLVNSSSPFDLPFKLPSERNSNNMDGRSYRKEANSKFLSVV